MAKRKKRGRKKKKKNKNPIKLDLPRETLYSLLALFFILLGILVMLSFTGQGVILAKVYAFLSTKFGLSMLILPFVFISAGLMLLNTKWAWAKPNVFLGTLLLLTANIGLFKTGELGSKTFLNLERLINPIGTFILFATIMIAGLLVITGASLNEIMQLIAKLQLPKKQKKDKEDQKDEDDFIEDTKFSQQEDKKDEEPKSKGFSIPKINLPFGKKQGLTQDASISNQSEDDSQADSSDVSDQLSQASMSPTNQPGIWEYPDLSLFADSKGEKGNPGDVRGNAQIIENTLDSFGIKAQVKEVNEGPTVTQYCLSITKGTRLAKITRLSTDLALALAAPTGQIRIEAPIAGRRLVGIEVPNQSFAKVTLKQMLGSDRMKEEKSKLAVSLGIDVSGNPIVADIATMPHLLIAGSTGSGKSVCINSFMCSLLFRASPDEVKFILVDPKRVELSNYNDIPHLLTPVIIEPKKVVSALKWATNLMDKRYKQLADVGVRNIDSYNELAGFSTMPNIVIVIDELADVMMFAPKEVEESITRIAQMARAVGIHLVLATQRPSVDIITGLIKANVPARIAFNVSSMTDSRVVLDSPGAEKLLGRGDMLFIPPDKAKPVRIQGTYVSDHEIRNLIDYIKSQGQKPEYEADITKKYKSGASNGIAVANTPEDRDDKFDLAVKLIAKYDKASSSLIQRRLRVGYARAARILDQLHEAGLVGPPEGSKPREVNIPQLNEYMSKMNIEAPQ